MQKRHYLISKSGHDAPDLIRQLLQLCPNLRPFISYFGNPTRASDGFALAHASLLYACIHHTIQTQVHDESQFVSKRGLYGIYYLADMTVSLGYQDGDYEVSLCWKVDITSPEFGNLLAQSTAHNWLCVPSQFER